MDQTANHTLLNGSGSPDRSLDAREKQALTKTVRWLCEPRGESPSPSALEVSLEDLALFRLLLNRLNIKRSRASDQRLIRGLERAYRCIARLRPEDLEREARHLADALEWEAYRRATYGPTRDRLEEVAAWAEQPVPSVGSPAASGEPEDPATVREARRRSETAAWVEARMDELSQLDW